MMKRSERGRELEERFDRRLSADLDYPSLLKRYGALWAEAVSINPHLGENWEEDIEADIRMARTLNGRPANT